MKLFLLFCNFHQIKRRTFKLCLVPIRCMCACYTSVYPSCKNGDPLLKGEYLILHFFTHILMFWLSFKNWKLPFLAYNITNTRNFSSMVFWRKILHNCVICLASLVLKVKNEFQTTYFDLPWLVKGKSLSK